MDSFTKASISSFSQFNLFNHNDHRHSIRLTPSFQQKNPTYLLIVPLRNEFCRRCTNDTSQITSPKSSRIQESNPIKFQSSKGSKKLSPLEGVLNSIDEFITKFLIPPFGPNMDPKSVLSGNFAPVDELPPTKCEVVEGTIPECLNGAYIRNGPNPQFYPHGPYHLFDGDGMLHSIMISNGEATFCNRFVHTQKYLTEKEIGYPIIPSFISQYNGLPAFLARIALDAARVLLGQFRPKFGRSQANTSLAIVGCKLLALHEFDFPYSIKFAKNGDILTQGIHDFDGKLSKSMTAHPKIDQDTGEAFAFRYDVFSPYLTYFRIDSDGVKQPDVPIRSIKRSTLIHDFGITKKYAIFPDTQVKLDVHGMIVGRSAMSSEEHKVPRLGVIPRYDNDETNLKWFKVPGFNTLHVVNSWDEDEGDKVVLIAPNALSTQNFCERLDLVHNIMEKIIDIKRGIMTRNVLSTRNLEFAVINPSYGGKKNRYVYAAIMKGALKMIGLVKLDTTLDTNHGECSVANRFFGEGCYGGEPFFVAKQGDNPNADEDDGYVVTYLHNENTGESSFMVMDVKSPQLDIVASVRLPQRVPYGLHGLFVRQSILDLL